MAVLQKQGLSQTNKKIIALAISLFLIQFYGVTASNGSANSSTSTSTTVTQLWSFSTIGSVYAAPIVVDGYVYVNSYFDQAALGGIFCLNASTGTQAWNYTTNGTTEGRPFSPVVADGRIYFNVQSGYLYCLNAYTGAHLWNISSAGYGNSPRLADGKAYITSTDGNVYALDVSTGAKIWTHTIGSPVYGQPVVTGDYIYVTLRDDENTVYGIYCLDVSTGDEVWKVTIPEIAGYPVVEGDYLFVGALNVSSSNPIVFDGIVYAFDASTGSKIWSYPTGTFSSDNPNFVPVVVENFVYFSVGNKTFALDASTGTEKWKFTSQNAIGSPLFSSSYVYVSSGANVYCIDASTGTQKWASKIEGDEASSPVIAESQVYVGSVGSQYFAKSVYHNVYALDALSGDKMWNCTIEGNPYSIAVAEGVVYVGTSFATTDSPDFEGNGAVYALKPITSSPLPSTLLVIAVVVVIMILAVVFLIYRIRRKEAQSPSPV